MYQRMSEPPLRTGWLFALGLILVLSLWGYRIVCHAASPQLVKAAEHEGKVVYYSTMSVQETDKAVRGFMKKYPGIKAEYFRITKEKLVSRLLAEDSADRTIISSMHRVPARPDVTSDPPRLTQGLKFFTLKPETAQNYDEWEKLFFKIFGTRS